MFKPLSKKEELEMVQRCYSTNDFSQLVKYLDPLVKRIVEKYVSDKEKINTLYQNLPIPLEEIVSFFLKKKTKDYKFSVYFSWWVKEAVEQSLL